MGSRKYHRRSNRPVSTYQQIEPARGATYGPTEDAPYAVYEYSTYPRGSVLAGQERRVFIDNGKLEDLKAKYPKAEVMEGSCYQEPFLGHLPDEGDEGMNDEYFSREDSPGYMDDDTRFGWDGDNGGDR